MTPDPAMTQHPMTKRDFLRKGVWGALLLALGGLGAVVARHARNRGTVWQLDPTKCVACGNCAKSCSPSRGRS